MTAAQSNQRQDCDGLTADELQYLRVGIIIALGNPDIKTMPKTEAELEKLYVKVSKLYKEARARE